MAISFWGSSAESLSNFSRPRSLRSAVSACRSSFSISTVRRRISLSPEGSSCRSQLGKILADRFLQLGEAIGGGIEVFLVEVDGLRELVNHALARWRGMLERDLQLIGDGGGELFGPIAVRGFDLDVEHFGRADFHALGGRHFDFAAEINDVLRRGVGRRIAIVPGRTDLSQGRGQDAVALAHFENCFVLGFQLLGIAEFAERVGVAGGLVAKGKGLRGFPDIGLESGVRGGQGREQGGRHKHAPGWRATQCGTRRGSPTGELQWT